MYLKISLLVLLYLQGGSNEGKNTFRDKKIPSFDGIFPHWTGGESKKYCPEDGNPYCPRGQYGFPSEDNIFFVHRDLQVEIEQSGAWGEAFGRAPCDLGSPHLSSSPRHISNVYTQLVQRFKLIQGSGYFRNDSWLVPMRITESQFQRPMLELILSALEQGVHQSFSSGGNAPSPSESIWF